MSTPAQTPNSLPTAAFAADTAHARELEALLARLGETQVHVQAGGCAAAQRWCAQQRAEVLLIDLDGESAPLQALAELGAHCDPGCRIVALGSGSDVDLYRALLHSGVLDYLLKPVRLDLLASTLERARDPGQESFARTGRTIAVTASAGGLGTSSVVAALGQLLSGTRHMPVAVVDFDRQKNDQNLLLGVQGDAGLGAALASRQIDARLLERAMLRVNPRLHLLAQEQADGQAAALDTGHLLELGAALCRLHNQVLWDLPAGLPHGALEILQHSETRILLTDLSVQGARNTQRLLARIGDESDGQQLLIVQSHAHGAHAGIAREQFEEFIGRRIDLALPYAGPALAESLLGGALALDRSPPLHQALLDLADLACGRRPERRATAGLLGRLKQAIGRRAA
ncbi:MAG: hypothetical protein GAK45_00801 [Pseudomonas citronellolis]|nr:MAG: hypothetical protein GAK45_00801 [Pseudomonas citronellolis]